MTLIGKENLCGLLADKALEAQLEDECTELAIAECLSIVRRMPEAVVRCKDCRNYRLFKNRFGVEISRCMLFGADVENEAFCSYGERKEGAD